MKAIIKNPLTGKDLQIADYNFPKRMNWKEAMNSAKNLGKGWRLPTVFELELIRAQLYLNNKGYLPVGEDGYWQRYWSSELDEHELNACAVSLHKDEKQTLSLDGNKCFVRAVKNIRAVKNK